MALSNYTEDAFINAVFRNTSFPAPTANVYVALYTVAPTDSSAGTEVSGGSYSRVAVTTTGGWTDPAGTGITSNISLITFPTATASWGTIVAVGIFDTISGGNLLAYQNMSYPKTVLNNYIFKFVAGALTFQLD
jgi:hypothetical protein